MLFNFIFINNFNIHYSGNGNFSVAGIYIFMNEFKEETVECCNNTLELSCGGWIIVLKNVYLINLFAYDGGGFLCYTFLNIPYICSAIFGFDHWKYNQYRCVKTSSSYNYLKQAPKMRTVLCLVFLALIGLVAIVGF